MILQLPAGPAPASVQDAVDKAGLRAAGAARIPTGLAMHGDGRYPCDLAVEGEVRGSLMLPEAATLLVTPGGQVDGSVSAGHARVEGLFTGKIDCSKGAVEFGPSARCTAHVLYRELSVERGAEVEAQLQKVGSRHV